MKRHRITTIAAMLLAVHLTKPPPAAADERGTENAMPTAGPRSVPSQLKDDQKVLDKSAPLIPTGRLRRFLQPYYDFKENMSDIVGLTYGGDYNIAFQEALARSIAEPAAGGVVRFYGHWQFVGRDNDNDGGLIYKVENRHRIGTDFAPQALGPELGYAGLTATTFSDVSWVLSNFYWVQKLWQERIVFVLGFVDTTDYVDLYTLANPWTDFLNFDFSNNPTIAAPNQGLGAAFRINPIEHFYLLLGFADANGNPERPLDNFGTFFGDAEYFAHLELGWIESPESAFSDHVHATLWYVDERAEAGVPSGWGAAVSASRTFAQRWLPFARVGASNGGGGRFLQYVVAAGTGIYFRQKADVLGLGLNWGRPSAKTYGSQLRDQYTIEIYYRAQVFRHLAVTPDLQVLVRPADNPEVSAIAVIGARARLIF